MVRWPKGRSRGATLGATVAALIVLAGLWWLAESTVPAEELEAAEQTVAEAEAELLSLTARTAQLEADLDELRADALERDEVRRRLEVHDAANQAWPRIIRARYERPDGDTADPTPDNVCSWFTPEVMTDIVLVAQDTSATLLDVDATFGPDGCEPGLFGRRGRWGLVWMSQGWPDDDGLFIQLVIGDEEDGSDSASPTARGDAFLPHHLLDDAVTHRPVRWSFGWDEGIEMEVRIEGRNETLLFGLAVHEPLAIGFGESNEFEWLGLAVLDLVLRQMGWVP